MDKRNWVFCMKQQRWFFYLLAGILFGIFDFYFQIWNRPWMLPGALRFVVVWGVWLVLLVPVALVESRISQSAWMAAAAGAFTWSVSIIAYYLFMGVKLVLIGEESRPEMHLSNRGDPYFWRNINSFFAGDFLSGVSEWLVVALVGGSLIGLLTGLVTLRLRRAGNREPSSRE